MDGRPGVMISSENGCRGSGSRSHARPMRRASSSESIRAETPVTSREACSFAAVCTIASNGIDSRHHQQVDGLAFLLRHRDDAREQFPLVIGEELVLRQLVFARARRDAAHRHHDDIVPAQIGLLQHALQMRHAAVVAHGDQNAARPGVNGIAVRMLISGCISRLNCSRPCFWPDAPSH